MNQDTSAASNQAVPVEDVTGKRILAALIDIVVLAVIFVVFAMLFGDSTTETGENSSGVSLNLEGGPALIYFLVVLAYYWIMEAATGKTLGKMVMGLRVKTLDGSPYSFMKAFLRNLLRLVDALPFLYLLGLIIVVSSKKKQRLGDMVAGTTVGKA